MVFSVKRMLKILCFFSLISVVLKNKNYRKYYLFLCSYNLFKMELKVVGLKVIFFIYVKISVIKIIVFNYFKL